ncbi:MAG: 4Fe-4S dicluster domain-containing protein [Promethearchaeati archaeon]
MQLHSDFNIRFNPENCTGCRICQLICSFTFTKQFNPDLSHIKIRTPYGHKPQLKILDTCKKCGLCIEHCIYEALEIVEEDDL